MAFRAVRALWPETGLVAVLLAAQTLITTEWGKPGNPTVGLPGILANLAATVLVLPYTIAVYRYAMGLPVGSLRDRVRHVVRRKDFLAYNLGIFLLGILLAEAWNVSFPYHSLVFVVLCGLSFWLTTRLFVMGPTLALDGFDVTVREAFRATAGQIWTLFRLGFYVALPLLGASLIVGLAASVVNFGLNLKPAPASFGALSLPFIVFGHVLKAVLETKIFQRLLLPMPPQDVR